MKTLLKCGLTLTLAVVMLLAVTALAFAAEKVPETITVDGREFIRDARMVSVSNPALPDEGVVMMRGYTVTASDVWMYIDYGHGHGGDQFAYGYIQATAPSFYARAEIRLNGAVVVTGINKWNDPGSNISYSASYLAVGIDNNRKAHIFYGW